MSKLPEGVINKIEQVADLREKEFEVRKAKTERDFDRLQTSREVLDNIKNFNLEKDGEFTADKVKEAYQKIARDRKILAEKLIFINDGLTAVVPFARGSLYLIGAVSGHGKSTAAANVSYPLWKLGKKVLVLANEETAENVYARIACLDLGADFNLWRNNIIDKEMRMKVDKLIPEVMKFVEVKGTGEQHVGLTTTLEGVQAVLNQAKEKNYACVIIDYFQNVTASVHNPSATHTDILYSLGAYLKEYIKDANMPVVLFTQLMPLAPNSTDRMFQNRIKWCKGIYDHSSTVIEILRMKEKKKSFFVVDKDRWGHANESVECKFVNGRFLVAVSPTTEIMDQIDSMVALAKAGEND